MMTSAGALHSPLPRLGCVGHPTTGCVELVHSSLKIPTAMFAFAPRLKTLAPDGSELELGLMSIRCSQVNGAPAPPDKVPQSTASPMLLPSRSAARKNCRACSDLMLTWSLAVGCAPLPKSRAAENR